MQLIRILRPALCAGLAGLFWLAGWVSFSAAAGHPRNAPREVLQQAIATHTASPTPTSQTATLTATLPPTLTQTAAASLTPASATPTLAATATATFTPSPTIFATPTVSPSPSFTPRSVTPVEEAPTEEATPPLLLPSPGAEMTATVTLRPLPLVTYQYPQRTPTYVLLARQDQNGPAKGDGALPWMAWLRCGWPLLALALLWLGLVAWWLVAHAITRHRD